MTIYVGFEIEVEDSNNAQVYSPIYHLASETIHITGLNSISIDQYHQNKRYSMLGEWRLEQDTSLLNGAEFITPPLETDIALETLEKFLAYVDRCNCLTTSRTGLHINMSSTNMCLDDINIDNIIPQINYKLLFNLWNSRFEKSMYSKSLKSLLRSNIQPILHSYYNGINSRKVEKLKDVNKILLRRRSGFINLRKNTDRKQYFEIRIAGGANYHRKFKDIEQTVRHFEKILLNSQKNTAKSYKSLASYINRVLNYDKQNGLFIPDLLNINAPYSIVKEKMSLIKKTHNYNIEQLHIEMQRINAKTYFLDTKLTLLNVINIYFKQYITYIYRNQSVTARKNREKEGNYVIYHYYKYIYNNSGKTECIEALKQERHIRLYPTNKSSINNHFDFSIPEDEPKQEILWFINCVKELDTVTKKQFVSKLPLCMLNFLLAHKRPGMVNITKRARKELTKNMTVQNKELKEKVDMR